MKKMMNGLKIFTIGCVCLGQDDSPELPETPENTEKMENFIKVSNYLTKLKEALINYIWEKSQFKKR